VRTIFPGVIKGLLSFFPSGVPGERRLAPRSIEILYLSAAIVAHFQLASSLARRDPLSSCAEKRNASTRPGFPKESLSSSPLLFSRFATRDNSPWSSRSRRTLKDGDVRNSREHYLILLDEAHEGRPLDLDRLAVSIVQCDDEVEKIAFPQITRRLLLKVRPAHADPAINRTLHLDRMIVHSARFTRAKVSKVSSRTSVSSRSLTSNDFERLDVNVR